MATASAKASLPERPQHQRNKSSRSGILKSLVSPKARAVSPEMSPGRMQTQQINARTQSVPLLPADHPHASRSKVLGERQSNVQSPPSSPSKRHEKTTQSSRRDDTRSRSRSPVKMDNKPKKSKSSTSLSAMFGKINRSSKDLSTYSNQAQSRDKENTTPPSSASGPMDAPIWAQFSSTSGKPTSRPGSRDNDSADNNIHDEIARYTPSNYSPSKQRNFNGSFEQPSLRPALKSRPQSTIVQPTESFMDAIGRRLSGARASMEARRSEENFRRASKEYSRRTSVDKPVVTRRSTTERKVSGSSTEQAAPKERLNIAKRGGRVMAAVAALQGRSKGVVAKEEPVLDPKAVDAAFEQVLDSRNVPHAMREKMRSLTLRVKADFVRQDQGASRTAEASPHEPSPAPVVEQPTTPAQPEDDSKSTKRSRPRSRTFTFTKTSKSATGTGGDASPSKKQRSQSKSRPVSIHIPKTTSSTNLATPTTPTGSASSKRGHAPAPPADYIIYLRKHQDPVKIEVGRLHKLRILLRNETVAWVDSFVSQGGMAEVVSLLHRTMAIEWREEHEDQLLHETLLCLKGMCTTERAMLELEKVADELFPALLAMLFDDEKKGPAEYTTRTIIVNVLFSFLASSLNSSPVELEQRARRILTYLGEPARPEESRPVDFVLGMRVPRPYKLWCREVSNVTKEVFWIFLHQLNVVPLPKRPSSAGSDTTNPIAVDDNIDEDRAKILKQTYTHRNFPGLRPPVPAAPYIGGVEWDATTYITAHLDLLNGLIASLPTPSERNSLRAELQSSGFEKVLGITLRTCKEKFYAGVHDGLRAWVAAASEDGWETMYVREGPGMEEQANRARSQSPKKNPVKAPQLEEVKVEAFPKLELSVGGKDDDGEDDGWLG